MAKRTLVAPLIVWFCFLLLLALLSPSVGRASGGSNLLQNPSFEQGTAPWLSGPSGATFIITSTQVYSGTWAASLNKEVGAVPIYIYQDVPVVGGGYYTLSGWAYKDSPNFRSVYLRIEWRDAWGEIYHVDSHILTDDEEAYQRLCIPGECDGDGVQAPNNAVEARIKCVADIQEADPETPIFFDELSFTFQGSNWKVHLPLVVKNY